MSTTAPRGFWSWARELAVFAMGVAVMVMAGVVVYAIHVHRTVVRVESSVCHRAVVFTAGGKVWRYRPVSEKDCRRFVVGESWLISWNRDGYVQPLERRQ